MQPFFNIKNFDSRKEVTELLISKVTDCSSTKKGLHALVIWFWDCFLVFYKEASLFNLSEPVTNRNSKEQLL